MPDFWTLTRASIKKLQADHQQIRTAITNLQQAGNRMAHKHPQRDDSLVAKATGSVAARSGTATTSGTFTIQDVATTGALADTTDSATVFNLGDTAITSGDYYNIHRDYRTGAWVTHAPGTGGGGSAVREISYVKAQGYWTYSGSVFPSTTSAVIASVSVKLCDKDGTETAAAAFTCWLPITNTGNDPNVVPGQIFIAAETIDPSDSAASWSGISGYEDAAIGTVRMLTQNEPAAATSGWAKMDGTENSVANGGTAIDMTGAVPKHDCDVSPGTSNSGTADPSTTSDSTTPGTTLSAINTTLNGGTVSTDSSGTLTTDAASGTTGSAGAHTHATGSHTHTVSGTSGSSSGTTGASGTLTTSTHTIDLVWCEEDMSYTETVAGFSGITDDDADGDPENYTHNHTIASHSHSIGSHSHSFSATTGSSSGSTASSGAHTHTFGSHDHDLASHSHSIAVHNHDIPQLSVPGVAHRHGIDVQLTKTLCFFERVNNSI